MTNRKAEIDRQVERAIYTTDPDAIPRLEKRIADLIAQRERIKAINREIRRGAGWEDRITPPLTGAERADLERLAREWAGVFKPGYPPYALNSINGNLTRQRKRLAMMRAEQTGHTDSDDAPPTLAELAILLSRHAPPLAPMPPLLLTSPPGECPARQLALLDALEATHRPGAA